MSRREHGRMPSIPPGEVDFIPVSVPVVSGGARHSPYRGGRFDPGPTPSCLISPVNPAHSHANTPIFPTKGQS
ncbi:hypothetical protein BD779DRAFT_1668276 [Infundibulicybe gibba]|nr:hypothetical protein BD779DRAFT_1668276 [Infundibulicybe gibba]